MTYYHVLFVVVMHIYVISVTILAIGKSNVRVVVPFHVQSK